MTISWITTLRVTELLDQLYAQAAKANALLRHVSKRSDETPEDYANALRMAYRPVGREFGELLYAFVRSSKAKAVVEFGTSFGISTIFLAAALRDNGGGKLITTEVDVVVARRATKNLATAGLDTWVEIRPGDALETLKTGLPREIDFVLLDGKRALYLDVLKLLEPRLKPGAIIASVDTDHPELESFLAYIRAPKNGYLSSAVFTPYEGKDRDHEITVRIENG
jgi:predicted O-methyltransferase YrrM